MLDILIAIGALSVITRFNLAQDRIDKITTDTLRLQRSTG